jgi:L-cystine uptake protein TcyP (sodium:dicarboxylate symporter family)
MKQNENIRKEEILSLRRMSSVDRAAHNIEKPSLEEMMRLHVKDNFLLMATVICVISGIGLGFTLRSSFEFNENQIRYFGFLGQLFLRMLKFLILPLIAFSLIRF